MRGPRALRPRNERHLWIAGLSAGGETSRESQGAGRLGRRVRARRGPAAAREDRAAGGGARFLKDGAGCLSRTQCKGPMVHGHPQCEPEGAVPPIGPATLGAVRRSRSASRASDAAVNRRLCTIAAALHHPAKPTLAHGPKNRDNCSKSSSRICNGPGFRVGGACLAHWHKLSWQIRTRRRFARDLPKWAPCTKS